MPSKYDIIHDGRRKISHMTFLKAFLRGLGEIECHIDRKLLILVLFICFSSSFHIL